MSFHFQLRGPIGLARQMALFWHNEIFNVNIRLVDLFGKFAVPEFVCR